MLLACRYLRERGDVDRVLIVTDARNRASAAVAEGVGFTLTASQRREDGEARDVWTLVCP